MFIENTDWTDIDFVRVCTRVVPGEDGGAMFVFNTKEALVPFNGPCVNVHSYQHAYDLDSMDEALSLPGLSDEAVEFLRDAIERTRAYISEQDPEWAE